MMFRTLALILFTNIYIGSGFSKSIEAFVKNSVFYSPEAGPYVETDMLITGNSISYVKNDNGKFSGAIEVRLLFKQGDQIAAFDKYILHSIELEDTANIAVSLIDKKRFPLPVGAYNLEATFRDINGGAEPYSYTEPLIVDYDENKVSLSDITLIDTYHVSEDKSIYSRNGFHISPYVINFYPENITKLIFYAEVYNSNKLSDDKCLAVMAVKKFKANDIVGSLYYHQKIQAQPVNVLFSEFDISNLLTGNYILSIEIRSKENELLAVKQLFFQRYKNLEVSTLEDLTSVFIENTFVEQFSTEGLVYQLSSVIPIANISESKKIKELIKTNVKQEMARYLLFFWMSRNSSDPRSEWERYQAEVKKVNDNYSSPIEYGFETDCGRVYLQYGPPTEILPLVQSPGTLPYEIWQYNQFEHGQTNVKFVFYYPIIASNNCVLIHSNANGEIRNEDWQRVINEPYSEGNSPLDPGSNIRAR